MTERLHEATLEADAPLVTVAVRAFNSRRFIRAALEGAVAQTYRPLEIVVCDDSINRTGAGLPLLGRDIFDAR
jgi:purine nucleoside phosphorylase